jgi:uncharacterized protein YdhG (YjbR/CyaY superfamily)
MIKMKPNFNSIDEYIGSFPPEIQKILQMIRYTVKKAAPEALETIKYGMPTFTLHGNLIHFGAYKNHIGLYPAPKSDEKLKKELSVFKTEKSTIRFPLDKPIPPDLIKRIIKIKVKETEEKTNTKTV